MALTLDDMNAMLANSPFIAFCGFQVTEIDGENQALTMTMPLKPEFERMADSGQFHGGPLAALVDTAACFAVSMVLGHGVPTINFRIDYLRPAINTALTARAIVRRAGRTVALADVDVFNDEGKLLAVGRGTFSSSAG